MTGVANFADISKIAIMLIRAWRYNTKLLYLHD